MYASRSSRSRTFFIETTHPMIKLLIDAFPLLAPKSGVGYYSWHLLNALQKHHSHEYDFTYFYGRRFSKNILPRPTTFDTAARATLKKYFPDPYRLTQPIKEFVFKRGVRKYKPHLYHQLNYVLLPFDGPQVVTVFDLSIARFPELHPSARVHFFNDYFYDRLKNATRIIVISEFTKRELIDIAGVPEDIIDVIYLAAPANFTRPTQNDIDAFCARQNLDNGYILYLGNLEPRKNLVTLLKAYADLRQKMSGTPPLVLAGEPTWLSESIFDTISSLALDEYVVVPGYVPEKDLPLWYAGATVFTYPSRYEGFGLPIIEAMAVGTPAIAARAGSLPEIAHDAAVLVDPDDPDEWSNALHDFLNSHDMCSAYAQKGYERAAQFSWEKCAHDTVTVYKEIYS